MAAYNDWLKGIGGGGLGAAGSGLDVAVGAASGESKLKIMIQLVKDLAIGGALWSAALTGAFAVMGKGVKALLVSTGSLEATLNRLRQIQGLQKVFEPLVGGAAAARLEVAKLVNFAANKNLKLGDVAEGARALKLMTGGAYSGAEALKTVADAAAGTGSNFTAMADAVGEFSAALSSGGSIQGATDQLEKMGAISQATGNQLLRMQESGSTSNQVFSALTTSMGQFAGQSDKVKDSLDGINTAYEQAAENLQEKFAAPFSEEDAQHTKAMTEAMIALAPTVEYVSNVIGTLFSKVERFKDSVVVTIAQSGIFSAVIKGATVGLIGLAATITMVASSHLAVWLKSVTFGMSEVGAKADYMGARLFIASRGMIGLSVATNICKYSMYAFRLALMATGILALVSVLATVGNAVVNFANRAKEEQAKIDEMRQAHEEAIKVINQHAEAARSLADRHSVLQEALANETKAQEALNEARKKGNPAEIGERKAELAAAKNQADRVASQSPAQFEETPEARRKTEEDIRFQEDARKRALEAHLKTASPEVRIGYLQGESNLMASRAAQGEAGATAAVDYAKSKATSGETTAKLKTRYEEAQSAEKAIADIRGTAQEGDKRLPAWNAKLAEHSEATRQARSAYETQLRSEEQLGLNAPEGTSTRLEAEERKKMRELTALQKRAASDPSVQPDIQTATDQLDRIRHQASAARRLEADRGQSADASKSYGAQAAEETREKSLTDIRLDAEKQIAGLKTEGFARAQGEHDIALARIAAERALEEKKGQGATDPAKLAALDVEAARETREKRIEKAQHDLDQQHLATEEKTAALKSTGFQRAQDEYDLKNDSMAKEAQTLDAAGQHDKAREVRAQQQAAAFEHAQTLQSQMQARVGLGLELATSKAQVGGDSRALTKLGDFSTFKSKYDELKGQGFSEDVAKSSADALARNAITLSARQQGSALLDATKASSITRIGGGGNVANVQANPLLDAVKRQTALHEMEVAYLKVMAESGGAVLK